MSFAHGPVVLESLKVGPKPKQSISASVYQAAEAKSATIRVRSITYAYTLSTSRFKTIDQCTHRSLCSYTYTRIKPQTNTSAHHLPAYPLLHAAPLLSSDSCWSGLHPVTFPRSCVRTHGRSCLATVAKRYTCYIYIHMYVCVYICLIYIIMSTYISILRRREAEHG